MEEEARGLGGPVLVPPAPSGPHTTDEAEELRGSRDGSIVRVP